MAFKQKCLKIYEQIDKKYEEQFGFKIMDTTFFNIVYYLHAPKDSSSLAVTRILFGLAMLFDIPDERGGAVLDKRWGNPKTCHFPLIPFITVLPLPIMAITYLILWLGALGMMLGYKFRSSCLAFLISYWYLFLIEKSFWNNHSYLFGLVAFIFTLTDANCYWSLDVYFKSTEKKETVPYWNYFLLKYQFFILYFLAGVKKGNAEWLSGYSVQRLGEHWVFAPFRIFMNVAEIDYYIVHWFIFLFDLTIAFWMMWSKTRHFAMFFCALFHFMNSRLFRIGMFPWVCLATLPLFYPFDWPKRVIYFFQKYYYLFKFHCVSDKTQISQPLEILELQNCGTHQEYQEFNNSHEYENIHDIDQANYGIERLKELSEEKDEGKCKKNIKTVDENVEQLGGYSNAPAVTEENNDLATSEENIYNNLEEETKAVDNVKVVTCKKCTKTKNRKRNKKLKKPKLKEQIRAQLVLCYVYLQILLPFSHFWTLGYNNWTNGLYGYSWDMMVHTWDTQIVAIIMTDNNDSKEYYIDPYGYAPNDRWTRHGDMVYQYAHCLKKKVIQDAKANNFSLSNNISIYFDVWTSLNGRFTQRLFDSKVDVLNTTWSPFEEIPFLVPLINEALGWRKVLDKIRERVKAWSDYSQVIFIADLPGRELEKFIPPELLNVSLTVLKGSVGLWFQSTEKSRFEPRQSLVLKTGNTTELQPGLFHKIVNIGQSPAYYMFTFENITEVMNDHDQKSRNAKPKLPILKEFYNRLSNMVVFAKLVIKHILGICYSGECH